MEEKLLSIKQLAEESSQKAHKVQIANKLIDTMANLEQNFEHNQRRWIWELIQNAKDVCHENSVKIHIRLKENMLEFSHTGEPFRTEDLVFLIEQTSSKQRAEQEYVKENEKEEEEIKNQNQAPQNTGKFGTGFITTHMLSRNIIVSGVWKGGKQEKDKKGRTKEKEIFKKFELDLDRTAKTQKEMIKNIEKSFKVFGELDENEEIPDFNIGEKYNTKFKYLLDQKGLTVAQKGLDDLQYSALLTMLFNPQIKSLRVNDKTRNFKRQYKFSDSVVYQKEDEERKKFHMSLETFIIYETEGEQKETETKKSYLLIKSEYCACVVELVEDEEKFKIVAKDPMAPVIYADFPLIGSENFPFPFYVNSHYFRPNEPRSSLLMKGNSEDVAINKALFKIIRKQTEALMKRICLDSQREITNRHLLAVTAMPKDVDEAFYGERIQYPLRKILFSLPIIENIQGKYTTLIECMIPKADVKYVPDLHDLIEPIFFPNLIKKDLDYITYWLNMFTEEWEQSLRAKCYFNVENLLDFVNTQKEINEILYRLREHFVENDDAFKYLNDMYTYLYATIPKPECDILLNKYAVIPNQNGKLAFLDLLIEDDEIPDALKDVLFLFGNDIREELMYTNMFIQAKKIWNVHSVIQLIEQYYEEPNTDEDVLLQTSIKLLAIMPKKSELNRDSIKVKQRFLEIVCSFYEETVEQMEIMDVNYTIWERAETFILNKILKQIEEKATVLALGGHLNIEQNRLLQLLNNFYEICIEKNWRNLIKDRKIFPNQLGEFKLAKDLIIDRIEKDLSFGLEEENKYPENDMRAHMQLNDTAAESKKFKDISQAIFDIYKRLTADIGLEAKLLDKSLKLENSRIFSTSLGLREVSDRMEKNLQERRGFITNDHVLKKIVKDLQKITSKLHPEIRNRYFHWFEQNMHSILVDTMSNEQMKSAILDLALSDQEEGAIDARLLKKLISNSLSIEDIKILAERSKVKFPIDLNGGNPLGNPTKIRIGNDLDTILEKTVNEENDISFFTNPAEIQNNLVNLNITSDEQFKNLVESKKIKFPANINTIVSGDTFQYVLRILDIARKHLLKVLKENPSYDVSESFYDALAPNQNVLMNVKKNNIKIHIVVRPSAAEKIIIHNEREVQELDDPNNELWFSNGEVAMQMTMGRIFRSGFRVINL